MSHSNHTEPWYNYTEALFNDQIFSEFGFALESELLLGFTAPFPDYEPGDSHLGCMIGSHPSRHFNVSGTQIVKYGDAGLSTKTTLQPIPTKYYYNIQSNESWDLAVRRWGVDMLRPQSGLHGHLDYYKRKTVRVIQRDTLN